MSSRAFRPFSGGSAQIIAVTTNAGERTALSLPDSRGSFDAMFYNAGPGDAFLRAGSSTVVATSTDFAMIVPAGAFVPYGIHAGPTHLAHRGSAACTLYVMSGEGF
jgi:hypothetical protein